MTRGAWLLLGVIASLGLVVAGCGDDEGSAAPQADAGTDTGADADDDTGGDPDVAADAEPDAVVTDETMVDWLVAQGHFGFVYGTYGKGTYCGAFEKGAIEGYPDVRCTDSGGYHFSLNDDGSIRMEETIYLVKISAQNPDGSMPWFVDGGFSGAVIYRLTPTETPLANVDPAEAMEFDVQAVDGYGPDGYWASLGAEGARTRMIMARGQADDSLVDWTTAELDADTDTWTEMGDHFPGWFIQRYPTGAFYGKACVAADLLPGAVVPDGEGGTLDAGPGYCPPTCRMYTPANPDGANDLPVCASDVLDEAPRAAGLLLPFEPTVAEWLTTEGLFSFVHGTYGKGTTCGAFEKGAIPGYETVRCTDTGSYVFSLNEDDSIRLEEAVYVHLISTDNPDGEYAWFVAYGYAGSLVYRLTPADPALNVNPADAMEFDAEIVDGFGPDPFWTALGESGEKSRMVMARGQADDALLDWTTANYDAETTTWTDKGDAFPGWFIELFPEGAFSSKVCAEADRRPGAVVSDGNGGNLLQGPGYCAPACRMSTEADPTGANGLPVCEGDALAERPRASAL